MSKFIGSALFALFCIVALANAANLSIDKVFTSSVAGGLFGSSVQINDDADFLCIGAPGARPDGITTAAGFVDCYLLINNDWIKVGRLATNGTEDHFSAQNIRFVDVTEDLIEIYISAFGTPLGDMLSQPNLNDRKGSVVIYTFDKNTHVFTLKQVLDSATPGLSDLSGGQFNTSDADTGAKFGIHFAIHPDNKWLAVGALGENVSTSFEAGAAYLFTRDRKSQLWTFHSRLTRPGGPGGNFTYYGYQMTWSEDFLFVSDASIITGTAPEPTKTSNGNVWVYRKNGFLNWFTWFTLVQTINSDQPQSESDVRHIMDGFGCEIQADGNDLAIASCFYNDGGYDRGVVFMYEYTFDWTSFSFKYVFQTKLRSDAQADRNNFAVWGMSLNHKSLVVADPARTVGTKTYQGAAQLYEKDFFDGWIPAGVATYFNGTTYDFHCAAVSLGGRHNQKLLCGTEPITDFIFGLPAFIDAKNSSLTDPGRGPVPRFFVPGAPQAPINGYAVLYSIDW